MKLLKLEIHHIASIVQSTIDFENSAIAREPLFLICGETGAGKSTILNCICMALYNKVPTMPNSREYFGDQKIGDLSNFLRKGTGEGYIHLLFEEAGVRYEADWIVHRSHNKPDGKLQNIEWLLKNETNGEVIATKLNDVERQIQQIVGLDFDRFTRMFMLAQGQFNKFLTADEKQKSVILESLTRMDIYNKVGKYIHEKMSSVFAGLCKINQQIEDIHLLTDEEKAEKEQQIVDAETNIKKLNDEIALLDKKIVWWNTIKNNESNLAAAETLLAEKQARLESEDNKEKRYKIQLWDETVALRQCLADIAKQERLSSSCINAINNSQSKFSGFLSLVDRARRELLFKEEELRNKEEAWSRLQPDATTYENKQTIKAGLDAITSWKNENKKSQEDIEKMKSQLNLANISLQQTKNNVETSAKAWQETLLARDAKKKEIDATGKDNLQQNRNALAAEIAEMVSAKAKWQTVDLASKALDEGKQSVKQLSSELDVLIQKLDKAQTDCAEAQKRYADQQRIFDTRKLTIDDCAKELRKSLEEGKPCPICGSKHHEVQTEDVFAGLYQQAKEERDKAEKAKSVAQELLTSMQTQKNLKEKDFMKANNLLPALSENLSKAKDEWSPFATKYTHEEPFGNCLHLLDDGILQRQEQIVQLDKRLAAIKLLENNLQTLQKTLEDSDKTLQDWKEKLNKQQSGIEQANVQIEHCKQQIENNNKSIGERIEMLDKLFSWHQWKEEWEQQQAAFEVKLESESQRYMDCKQQLPLLRNSIKTVGDNVASCKESVSTLCSLFPDWQDISMETQAKVDYQSNLSEKLSAFVAEVRSLSKQMQDNQQTMASLVSEKEELLAAYQEKHSERQLTAQDIAALSLMTGDAINDLRQETDELKSSLQEVKGKIKQLTEDIAKLHEQNDKPAEEENMDVLQAAKAERNTQKEGMLNTVGGLKEQIKNNAAHDSDRQKLLEQQSKQRELHNNWKALDDMFGMDRFSKAAQQITFRFLLEKANQHLRNLYPRYNLICAPDSFALAVEDYEMGTSRPCTTLSGGESFIVSLALALGLSSLSDEKIKVDTLFIDEGFGTLSAEYLDTVMKVLEGLQRTGRKVGIISHVEILRERIPAQIQVVRKSRTESEIKVV